jgi:hypothetical protein
MARGLTAIAVANAMPKVTRREFQIPAARGCISWSSRQAKRAGRSGTAFMADQKS